MTTELKPVDGYETTLTVGTFLMYWGPPEADYNKESTGSLMHVVPMDGNEVMVLHVNRKSHAIYGCIRWQMGEHEKLTEPMRVLADIHNDGEGKRLGKAGADHYGTHAVCPSCGLGRKNFEYENANTWEEQKNPNVNVECDCGWKGTVSQINPTW